MTESEKHLYTLTINTYGHHNQINMLIEEMAELTLAISKRRRGKGNDNVEEEIADVQILLDQLKLMCDNKKISDIKEVKKQRLHENLYSFIAKNTESDREFDRYVNQNSSNPKKFTNEKLVL